MTWKRRFSGAALAVLALGAAPAFADDGVPQGTPEGLRPHVSKLLSKDSRERYAGRKALRALGEKADGAIPALLELVAREMDRPQKDRVLRALPGTGAAAADSLADFGARAHAALLDGLGSPRLRDRRAAAFVLRYRPPAASAERLTKALRDRDAPVRAYTLEALRKVQSPTVVKAVVDCLRDPVMDVRKQAVWCLAGIEIPRTKTELARMLKHPEPELRRVTADAIGHNKRSDVLPELLQAFKDEARPQTRYWMAVGLGNLGDSRAAPALARRLHNEPDKATREKIAAALGKLRAKDAVPDLIRAIKTRDAGMQKATAWALGEIRDARAVEPLLPLLQSQDEWVRKVAVRSLRAICHGAPKDLADHAQWRRWWLANRTSYL